MQGIYDIISISVIVLILIAFIFTWNFNPNQRYIINLEYYSLECLLNSNINDQKVYDEVMEGTLNKVAINEKLNEIVPRGYYYLFEIPKYRFRATNVPNGNNVTSCIQINRIYPVTYNFNGIHLIFAIWNKNQQFRVVPCEE